MFSVLARLAISNFLTRKVRVALTVAAVALSASLVVAVTSGYASVEGAARFYLDKYIGSTDATLTRQDHAPMPQSLAGDIAADPSVAKVTARLESEGPLGDARGNEVPGTRALIIGIQRPQDTRVETLKLVDGAWFDSDSGDVAVIDQVAAESLGNLKVGDYFTLPGVPHALKLKVVAIDHKPGILATHMQTVYLPIKTLQKFALPNEPPKITRVLIELKQKQNAEAFQARWEAKLKAIDPLLKLKLTRQSRAELDKNLQGLHMLSYLGGTVSMLAATFIVFSALAMGVSARQRTRAMLRAIGMFKRQVGWLVVLEGLLLALIGIAIGIPLGVLWVKILVSIPEFRDLMAAGVVVSWGGVLLAGGGSLLAALAASALPAWSAMRVSPREAMNPLAARSSSRVPWKLTIVALLLVGIDSFLMFGPVGWFVPAQWVRVVRFYGHFVLGLPGIMIGFFLLAPLFVYFVELLLGPVVAIGMGLRVALLRQQLSSGIWRAAGTASALMVGLAILLVMNVQGTSMLSGWKLPDRFPDVFIATAPLSPLTTQQVKKLEQTPGIKPGEAMPIAIAAPGLGTGIFALAGAAFMPDHTMFFGVDPDKAFKLMELDFREGNPADAQKLLREGHHIIVTEEFRQLKGLHIGDTLPLETPKHGMVNYTIAAVVWSPGIDVIVSMQDMSRQFDQRTAASIFGTLKDAEQDFGIDRYYLIAANLEPGIPKETVLKRIEKNVGSAGMSIGDIRQIKAEIVSGFKRLLLFVSTVAIAAMAVASLGVTNTIMASIRSRRWELGVLRSIGVTRGQLVRLVIAEALLLGLVGCALGVAAGALMSVNAHGLAAISIGYAPPTVVPWNIVAWGTGAIMVISLLASLWPVMSVARAEPLSLLQAGRAAG
jgi:putative ABC transport system permease protein